MNIRGFFLVLRIAALAARHLLVSACRWHNARRRPPGPVWLYDGRGGGAAAAG
jgi:hypothetical protein